MSSMPRCEAASISTTSSELPFAIATHAWHVLSGFGVGPCSQLSPLARMRASDVLPVPRGPAKRYAWRTFPAAIAFLSVRTTAPAAVKVTPELVMQLRRPTDLDLSPDGSRLAYIVAPSFRQKGQALESRLWIDGAPATEDGAADALPRFAPDGTLAYASDHGHAGRMSLRIDGLGELGEIPGSVEDIRWSPDSRSLLVLAADLGSDRAGVQTATKIREAGAGEEDPKVFRPAAHWRRLYLVDAGSGATKEVSPEGINVFEFDWAGGRAVAVCTDEPSESAWYDAWIGLLDLDSRSVERVHTAEWQLQCPRISPAGRIAWIEGFASSDT